MRLYPMITALWLLPCSLFSQTNISGVVNSYHKVVGIDNTLSALKLDNVSGILKGDRVMIIQMKGATVNTTTTSNSFGSIASLNEAGNYELATVCAVRNDSVFVLQQFLRNYSEHDMVQLVKIPVYASATVTGPLEAATWDSATGKGGVLSVIVSGTLTLNAPVTASGKGFKGGTFYKDGGGCATNAFQNYAYDPTPASFFIYTNVQRGGYKGESIADLSITLNGGKGANANGGGGGNNHNNGGGGGSNLAMAGNAGDNLSTTGCEGQQAGIGGYALSSNGGAKIFLGGGGGAGHANNTTSSTGGGYGGGIIFIQAETLVSNGHTISSNGSAGGNTNGDGASGGGGGGTIIMKVNNYTDALSIEARGGNGGRVNDENIAGRCYGEGGGGSGGVIYFSATAPAGSINVSGGSKGVKLNSTCATSTGTDGASGTQVLHYEFMESMNFSSCGAVFLNSTWKYFRAILSGNNVQLQWSANGGPYFMVERRNQGAWQILSQVGAQGNQTVYTYQDKQVLPGTWQYRVKLLNGQNTSYSPVQQVIIGVNEPDIQYDPFTRKIQVKGMTDNSNTLCIYDLSGRCIYQKIFNGLQVNRDQAILFPVNGIYIARMGSTSLKFYYTN